MISLIAALNKQGVIGINNSLPWQLPEDLKRFRRLTLNKPVVMGRVTMDSIGKPLAQRRNIVISNNKDYKREDCEVAYTIKNVMDITATAPEVMIIGGARIYEQFITFADRLYLTLVDAPELIGDAYFPSYNLNDWREVERSPQKKDSRHSYNFTFLTLDRIKVNL